MDFNSPAIEWGMGYFTDTLLSLGLEPDMYILEFQKEIIDLQGRFCEQGFRVRKTGKNIMISAEAPVGILYALIEIAANIKQKEEMWQPLSNINIDITDAPYMKYRGYCIGLQKQTGYYPDHPCYDWPISQENFPWFYNRDFLTRLLNRLVLQRVNVIYIWNGHPFASLLKLSDFPEALEVSEDQLTRNEEQYSWLCREAGKRGIWIVQKFYNVHMSDPLAKKRGWDIKSGEAHESICAYTRSCIREFIRKYPSTGLMTCMGEYLKEKHKAAWLKLILESVLDGIGPEPAVYPPVIIRAHSIKLDKYLPDAQKIYPNIITEMKHNNESFISTKPDSGNTMLARLSGCHIINVHLCANLEPFSWGSPRFILKTVVNMLKYEAKGIHIYPLRYWDWPNSAHVEPFGDQLHEHFIWWSAWGRYSWNPYRNEKEEDAYWTSELAREYSLEQHKAEKLLNALQMTGSVLPQTAGQFIVTSGNGQCINLGQFLITLAFSRQEFQDGGGYSVPQMCGFPIINETMWTQSPVTRMKRMGLKCEEAIQLLKEATDKDTKGNSIIDYFIKEIEIIRLISLYYEIKTRSCAIYFQNLYGSKNADTNKALELVKESLEIYREIVKLSEGFFKDASCLYHYRRLPIKVESGYRHWADVLPLYEMEADILEKGGLKLLLENATQTPAIVDNKEWNAGMIDTDEV